MEAAHSSSWKSVGGVHDSFSSRSSPEIEERAPDETGMEQVLSDLQALKGLYGLLYRGQANENLDEASRALLMRMLDNATQQALLRQAKMLSGPLMSPALERKLSIQPGGRRTSGADAGPRLMPVPSPSLSIRASETSRLLMPQSSVRSRYGHMLPQSSVRSRDSRRVYDDHHHLARVASNRSSRTPPIAMPRQQRDPVQRLAPLADLSDKDHRLRMGSGRGDRSSSLERSSRHHESSVSRSRAPSALGMARRHGSSTHRFRKLEDSGLLSVGVMSRRGSVRGTRQSSSSSSEEDDRAAVTTRSRIRPNDERTERRGLLRDEESEEEPSLPWRRRKEGSVSLGQSSRNRPRRTLERIDSGSTYNSSSSVIRRSSSGATGPTPSPSTSAALSPCSSSSSSLVSVSPRVSDHGFSASSLSKSRRRRERQERREGRLRTFKDKIAMVFHHRHDHHHHHHIENHRRPGSKEVEGRRLKSPSPWKYLGLGGMFHRGDRDGEKKKAKKEEKKKTKTTSRTVVTVPGKKPGRGGGGGNAQSLFDALVKHKLGARKGPAAPARARMVRGRSMSRVQVKKMHWWERLRRQRRGRGEVAGSSRPRRRLGQGKAL